jgi:hypothetical protein
MAKREIDVTLKEKVTKIKKYLTYYSKDWVKELCVRTGKSESFVKKMVADYEVFRPDWQHVINVVEESKRIYLDNEFKTEQVLQDLV